MGIGGYFMKFNGSVKQKEKDMKYTDIKKQQQNEIDNFPMFFAFNNKQFDEGMQKLGVADKNELCSTPYGGFIRKKDKDNLRALLLRQREERESRLKDREFLIDALVYELNNHEFCYTQDPENALEALGISLDNKLHNECYQIAKGLLVQADEA